MIECKLLQFTQFDFVGRETLDVAKKQSAGHDFQVRYRPVGSIGST